MVTLVMSNDIVATRPTSASCSVRKLSRADEAAVEAHLLRLTSAQRVLRFGRAMSDEGVRDYATGQNWLRGEAYGYTRGRDLIGLVEIIVVDGSTDGEVALSHERGPWPIMPALLRKVLQVARNRLLREVCLPIHSEDAALDEIIRLLGGQVQTDHEVARLPVALALARLDGWEMLQRPDTASAEAASVIGWR